MDSRSMKIQYHGNSGLQISVTPGHFTTNHSHINFYVDMTGLKTQLRPAKMAAEELSARFAASALVDTIICLEGTEIIGAFAAQYLAQAAPRSMNSGADISILTPEMNVNNQMVFQHSTQKQVSGKHVVLLLSSITTGKTVARAAECLQYYGGTLVGVGAIFSAVAQADGHRIYSIFTKEDLPHYQTFKPNECVLCKEGRKLDAIVNSMGYTPL